MSSVTIARANLDDLSRSFLMFSNFIFRKRSRQVFSRVRVHPLALEFSNLKPVRGVRSVEPTIAVTALVILVTKSVREKMEREKKKTRVPAELQNYTSETTLAVHLMMCGRVSRNCGR